jgi:hypothetical protein
MIEFLLIIGALIGVLYGVIWIIFLVIRAIIRVPSNIVYHVSGQAEIDKNKAEEAKARQVEQQARFIKSEKEREEKLKDEFSSEVQAFEQSLWERGITENSLVVIRKGDSIRVDVARFKKLEIHARYVASKPPLKFLVPPSDRDKLWPGHLWKLMRYTVYGPIVSVNVAENEVFVRSDIILFDASEHSIAKASPEFEFIYDEKVEKPLRDKTAAEQARKIKLDNAKNKLDDMFK